MFGKRVTDLCKAHCSELNNIRIHAQMISKRYVVPININSFLTVTLEKVSSICAVI